MQFENKRILITGVCGTIGEELLNQIITMSPNFQLEIIGIDNNESQLFFLDQKWLSDDRVKFSFCDVRDKDEISHKMRGIDIVFHTAALKHVIICERSPEQAIQSNIYGLQNIIHAATQNNVEMVIFTSSDKAVNPTNVMGTSKLMGERMITAANTERKENGPIFASTRFGNVLGSTGSVIPIFHNQISKCRPVTLTSQEMTRFVMSVENAVRLVIDSAKIARGGEVFITKMPVLRIEDLARVMIDVLAPIYGYQPSQIPIEIIGTKPGEKLYEELMNDEEMRRSVELKEYFAVLPAFRGIYKNIEFDYHDIMSKEITNPYNSAEETSMSKTEIREYLDQNKLLSKPLDGATKRYWPGDN